MQQHHFPGQGKRAQLCHLPLYQLSKELRCYVYSKCMVSGLGQLRLRFVDRQLTNTVQQFKWTAGEKLLKQYDDRDTETGEVVHRWFCSNCGSPMLTKSPRMPGITIIPSGVFDGSHEWKPNYEQWRRSKVCFVDSIRAVPDESRYDEHPDLREFEDIWSKSGITPAQEFIDR